MLGRGGHGHGLGGRSRLQGKRPYCHAGLDPGSTCLPARPGERWTPDQVRRDENGVSALRAAAADSGAGCCAFAGGPGCGGVGCASWQSDRKAISITVPPSIGSGLSGYSRNSEVRPSASCRRRASELIVRARAVDAQPIGVAIGAARAADRSVGTRRCASSPAAPASRRRSRSPGRSAPRRG